ncbi:MAG: HEAT repeat domain-containing protein [Gemmatimonadaceae bacterium]
MIDKAFLNVVMFVEVALLVLSLAVFFSHGLWLFVNQRRVVRLRARARESLSRLVNRGTINLDDIELLKQLPKNVQVMAFLEISNNVSGTGKERLRFVAREVELLDRARVLCESRRWTRRLRGARLFSRLDVSNPLVEKLLADPHPVVRAQAAEWAATHPSPAVVNRMLEMLADPATQARFAVQDALLRMGTFVAEPLVSFLETHDGRAAASALQVAEALASTSFRPGALRLSQSDDMNVRLAAANLLGGIGDEPSAARLTVMLKDSESRVRAAAARGLGRMQHWQAASQLAEGLRDSTWRVRRESGLALRAIGAPGALFLRRALKSDDAFAADMAQLVMDLPAAAAGG